MQGLADGYFVLPYTIGNYLAPLLGTKPVPHRPPGVPGGRGRGRASAIDGYLADQGHPLGRLLPPRARPDHVGLLRHGAHRARASRRRCRRSRRCTTSSRRTCGCRATAQSLNQSLEKAGRVDDFFQLAKLMCRDALDRNESCGGHFRAEYQTEDGEAQRDDEHFAYVAAWEWTGESGQRARPQGAARVRVRAPRPSGATSR